MNRRIAFASLLTLLVAGATNVRAAAGGTATDSDRAAVGSWVAHVTPEASSGVPPFNELFTISADGTLTEVDDNAPGPPFPFTPGHGVWKKGSKGTYVLHYLNLLYDPVTFAPAGRASVTVRVKLDNGGNGLSGTTHIHFTDADGVLITDGDGTITMTRITLDTP